MLGKMVFKKRGFTSFWPFKPGHLCSTAEWPKRENNTTPPPLFIALDNFFLHCFMNEIREDPSASAIIIPENYPVWTEETKQFLAEVLFERVSVSALCFVPTPLVVLAAVHKCSGIVVDFGASGIRISSAHKGILCSPENALVLPYGGNAIVEWTFKELKKKVFNITFDVAEDIVKKYATVSLNPDNQKTSLKDELYHRENIKILIDSNIRTTGPEGIFSPSITGHSGLGLIQAIIHVFCTCKPEFRSEISTVVISGGPSCIPNLKERLKQDLSKVLPDLNVLQVPHPTIGPHFGAAAICQAGIAGATKENYKERGVHCFWPEDAPTRW